MPTAGGRGAYGGQKRLFTFDTVLRQIESSTSIWQGMLWQLQAAQAAQQEREVVPAAMQAALGAKRK